MTIHVALHHATSYHYDRPVKLGPQVIRLRPAPHSRTPIESYALAIEPKGHFINWQQDPHGNFLARVVFPEKVDRFSVTVDLVADMAVYNPFDFFLEPDAETFPFKYDALSARDLEPYLETAEAGPLLKEWLAKVQYPEDIRTVDFLVNLNRRLQKDIGYVIRMEPGVQTPEDTLKRGTGSCRDSGWLLVQILRHLGIAARFVSGYLVQLVPDVKALDGPVGALEDFTDLHAWAEAYLPGAGWVGLDPTSGLLTGEGHIPLAATPHYASAAPIAGALEPANTKFGFEMSIARILETPRVTKPYTPEAWEAIDRLGGEIYEELAANDVRLTVGGEPTFVAVDDPDADEWNTEAVGPSKRRYAEDLIKRLKSRFAPNGFIHYGQGKWYPGEQLPRWALSLYWRKDGKPLWQQIEPNGEAAPSDEDAANLARGIARRLGFPDDAVNPAFEDPWHYIEQERKLPLNVDPIDNKLDDPLARERLAKVFEHGLERPVGYAIPATKAYAYPGERRWFTGPWPTRSGHLFLVPGNASIGYRLPLPSLPHIPKADYPHVVPEDPFAEHMPAFPDPAAERQPFLQGGAEAVERPGGAAPGQRGVMQDPAREPQVRTAITVEAREGRLYIFMPPLETAEDYLDLLAAIEDVVAETGKPVFIEGYPPPFDPRLNVIKVTPDPGVIEVNIHPSGSWEEMKSTTLGLYEDAHFSRLGTEKFMLDGRHSGTGGGNHLVMGGATPADSPFLRRPDLLASLITYWQHHPALSYLFSGLFIGPTSQAPRVDEARHDSLFELELAMRQLPDAGSEATAKPWLVDRLFRNLLVDVTGNTHRSEICIDKLYSPDSSTGRLGLVEFRAFEMPPHAQMSLVQQTLLLALVARFWKEHYIRDFVRWGTRLNDSFMLPHFIWRDLEDVIADMQRAGYALDLEWFAPHFEFRFPRFGEIQYGDIRLEIRHALEAWPVMGEMGAIGGTVRFVDSSIERLQVRATNFVEGRFQIACNGCKVPMGPTGVAGEAVGGVRYRAWQPAASLHPTIGIDAPLTFDLVDTWTGRAVAGCTYHVSHPGGRSFDSFPVNAYEAESRRLARFQEFGHSPGPRPLPTEVVRPEFPHTLDLRWS